MANTGMDKPTDSPRANRPPTHYSAKKTPAYLHISKRNLYHWRMAGLISCFKIGRAVRLRKSEVDAALERMWMGSRRFKTDLFLTSALPALLAIPAS
jgi:excisionase family DNA binding protein